MIRAPFWFIGLLIVAAIGVGVYAYFTTPLPLGLSTVIHTPGGASVPVAAQGTPGTTAPRAPAGQPLALGAAAVSVQSVQRNQNLTTDNASAPPGLFTVLTLQIQNAGSEPLTPQPENFRLIDDRGRTYAVDVEATRAANSANHLRDIFESSVPPGGQVLTSLAFETAQDVTPVSLRVNLGYGELTLPQSAGS